MASPIFGLPRHSSQLPSGSRFAKRLVLVAALLAGLAAGCASPGEPTARTPPVPEPIANLAASRSGNSVLLTFTVPQESAGGAPLEHPPTIQIYRDFEPVPATGELPPASPKHPALLATIPSELVPRYVANGEFRYSDPLNSADFTGHPNGAAVYFVRTRASGKKLSAPSNIATLRAYPAPDPIADLTGQVTATAVVLNWSAPQRTPAGLVPPIAAYRIYRAEAQEQAQPSASSQNEATAAPLAGMPPSAPELKSPFTKIGESPSPGFTDPNVEFGKAYVYSVRSVLDYSGATVESSDSNFLAVTPKDTFPPAAPMGLIGIYVPAAANVTAHVDLSWAVSPEPDLAGYRVYRSEEAGVLGTPLNADLLLTPAFRDMNVVSGHRYFYAVSAVDRSGNESRPSASVSVNVP